MFNKEMLRLNYNAFVKLISYDLLDAKETKRVVDNLDEEGLRKAISDPVGTLHNYLCQRVPKPERNEDYGTIDYRLELTTA